MHFAIWTNKLCNLFKNILQFGKYILQFGHLDRWKGTSLFAISQIFRIRKTGDNLSLRRDQNRNKKIARIANTVHCQVTMIVVNSSFQLSEL